MADVTVRRTEDFEAAFRGGFIKARAGLGVTSFGMQILRFPPHADAHPEHDHSGERRGGGLHRARGRGHPAGRRRGARPRAGRVRAGRAGRAAATGHRRERRPWSSRSAASPGSRSRSPSSPSRARPAEGAMADVTVKRMEEFEAIFGGGFRRARAGLGVSSFGLAVMDLPRELHRVPRPRPGPRPPGGGLHAALGAGDAPGRRRGRGGLRARAGDLDPGRPGGAAQDHHRRRAGAGAGGRRLTRASRTRRPSSPRRALRTRSGASTTCESLELGH